jgi:lipoate-protein ligase A
MWINFPYKIFSGKENMAIDHNLSENFLKFNKPILRFFAWKKPTLSIGFHQKEENFDLNHLASLDYDFVRRPTGGRAIFHDEELTYSIIFPKTMPKEDLYKKIHVAFNNGFEKLGLKLDLERKNSDLAKFYKTKESLSCFSASAKYETAHNGKKFIGSAQRIYDHAILQHGSIMLGDSFLKVMDFGNLSDLEKIDAKNKLREKTYFFNPNHSNLSEKVISLELKEALKTEFQIENFEESPFNLNTWT